MRQALWLLAGLAVLALVAGLGGCGGGDEVSGTGVDTAGKPSDPPTPTPSKIAYQSGGKVYVMNTDGTGKTALRAGGVPSWSPDGSRIAFEYSNCIWVMNADGTGAMALTQPVMLSEPKVAGHTSVDLCPDWSPDGNYLVFVRGSLNVGWYFSLQVIPDNGGTPTKILDLFAEVPYSPFPSLYWPAWSPDGRFIAFSREHQLPDKTMTNLLRALPMSGPTPTGPATDLRVGARYPGWNSTSTVLTYAQFAGSMLWNAPFAAGPPPSLGDAVQLTTSNNDCRPRWSPDDKQIVYSTFGTRYGYRDIYVIAAGGGTPVNLTNTSRTDEAFPDWSPKVF